MTFGRVYSVPPTRIGVEFRLGPWTFGVPSGGVVTDRVDDESLNVLPEVSAAELLEVIRSTKDPEKLRRAAWTVQKIGGEEHYRALEARLADELSQPTGHAKRERSPTWCLATVEVLAKDAGSRERKFLLELAEDSRSLGRLAAIRLAEHGVEAAWPELQEIVRSPDVEVFERQLAASLLYTMYDDPAGLRECLDRLSSNEEDAFSEAIGAFSMVPVERRGAEVVEMLLEALRMEHEADHVVRLMFQLDGVTSKPREVVESLRTFLTDRRRARQVLTDARSGRVRDFAAFYLARHLAGKASECPSFPGSWLARWRLRREVLRALGS
jgi:hypothetical protein